MFKLVRDIFVYMPKGRYETCISKLVSVAFVYIFKLVRDVFVYMPKGRYEP